jgi:hypothetical protein
MDGTCPDPIKRTVLFNEWRRLVFLHWRYDPAEVQALLPDGLTVDTFDGSAWVALVPFEMRVGLFGVPALPYLTVFPETNVRTYVIGPDGRTGVYFFSLDVNRPPRGGHRPVDLGCAVHAFKNDDVGNVGAAGPFRRAAVDLRRIPYLAGARCSVSC